MLSLNKVLWSPNYSFIVNFHMTNIVSWQESFNSIFPTSFFNTVASLQLTFESRCAQNVTFYVVIPIWLPLSMWDS